MPRFRDHHRRRRLDRNALFDCQLELLIGPVKGGPSEDDLRLAWELRGTELMSDCPSSAGTRPWGYWRFVLGEDKPRGGWDSEAIRLAELGELGAEELAAIREKANEARLRVGTHRERISGGNRESGVSVDAAAVALWDRVSAVSV